MNPVSEYHKALAAKTSEMALEVSNNNDSAGIVLPNAQSSPLPNPNLPSTTVTAGSVSSNISDEHLKYINYKLSQHQISEVEDRWNKSLVGRVCRCCKKIKSKVCTILKRKHNKEHTRKVSPEPRRNALEIKDGGRARTEFDIFLSRLRRLFRSEPTQELEGELQVVVGPDTVESYPVVPEGILRDSNAYKCRKPQVIHGAPRSTHQGVICLEADGLPQY